MAACAFLAIGVMALFPACGPKSDGTWMSCHNAQMAVFGISCAMSILALVALLSHGRWVLWLHVVVAVLAVVAAVVPGNLVPICMMEGMQCRSVMRPSVILLCIVIVASAVASTVLDRGRGRS